MLVLRDIHVDGVVAVSTTDVVDKRQVHHLRMLTQPPDVGLVTCQTGAVDTALLTGTDTDGLTVLHVADGVRLRVLQRNQGNDQVALGLRCEGLVLCGHILEEGIVVELDLVATLFESDAETLLRLDGSGLVARVDLNHIIGALALVLQYLDGLRRIVGSNHTVAHLTLQQLGCCGVAGVREGHEVTVARHTVGTAGSGIGAGDRRCVEILHIVHEIDFLQRVAQGQTDGSTGRTHMLERGSCGQTGSSLQLLHQLPGIKGVEEIDVTRTAVDHFNG